MGLKFLLKKVTPNVHLVSTAVPFLLLVSGCLLHLLSVVTALPIIGPEALNFGDLQPVTLIYQPLAVVQPQNSLPAPEGADFDGPDPGLNANIIGGSDCPNNYRRDVAGICRLEFVYGPNPFSAIIPQTFKGSLQFYMGLQVGNARPWTRRRVPFRIRGRLRNRNTTVTQPPVVSNSDDDDD